MRETLLPSNVECEQPHKKYVVLIGPSQSGKSTIVRGLREMGYTSLPEPDNETLLHLFLKDPQKYAFRNQLNITTKLMELETISELSHVHSDPHFTESGVLATQIYNRYLRDKGYISPEEFGILDALYQYHVSRLPRPDLVVFLDAPIHALQERAFSNFGTVAFEPNEMRAYWQSLVTEIEDQGIHVQKIDTTLYTPDECVAMILDNEDIL